MQPLSLKFATLQLRALARMMAGAPLKLKRSFGSAGGSDGSASAAKGRARAGSRAAAKNSTGALGQCLAMNESSAGGGSNVVTAASSRTVKRFAVCEDTAAASEDHHCSWWASDPPAFVMGIDCSVRSTGYCVLHMPTHPPLPHSHHTAAGAASRLPVAAAAAPRVAACGSISTTVGMASSIDPARFLTDVRACLKQVKSEVEKESGSGKWLVVVEDCLMQFQGRRSSADTIVNLARFNALVSGAFPLPQN
jgi:hypothetical protein